MSSPTDVSPRVRDAIPNKATPDAVRLLDVDPDLGELLGADRYDEAHRELFVRTRRLAIGEWDFSQLATAPAYNVGLLIIDGVLSRELAIGGRVSVELLGPGDVLRPWRPAGTTTLLAVEAVWRVRSGLRVAFLDRAFAARAARYPELTAAIIDRLTERSMRLATAQAISQLTGVDRRLKALLWHLAERWGRVTRDGVIIPLGLKHGFLGELVGARRPTISTALAELAGRGEVLRLPDGAWLLMTERPDRDALTRRALTRPVYATRPARRGLETAPQRLVTVGDARTAATQPYFA